MNCQIEHGASDSDVGSPCSNRAVATCADCGAAICSDCRMWCCGESFCQWCGDYHVTYSCLRKTVHTRGVVASKYTRGLDCHRAMRMVPGSIAARGVTRVTLGG